METTSLMTGHSVTQTREVSELECDSGLICQSNKLYDTNFDNMVTFYPVKHLSSDGEIWA